MKINLIIFFIISGFSLFSYAGGDLPFPLDQIELMSVPEVWVATSDAPSEWQELQFLIYHLDSLSPSKVVLRIQNKDRMTLDQEVSFEENKKIIFDLSWPQISFILIYNRTFSTAQIVLTGEGDIKLVRNNKQIK